MFDAWEKKNREIRAFVFGPMVKWLSKNGVRANHVTNMRLLGVSLFLFVLVYQKMLISATFLYGILLLLDTVDGPLARFRKEESDRGKFLDVFSDHVVYACMIMGYALYGLIDIRIAVVHEFIIAVVYLLSVIYFQEGKKTDWLIHPRPRMVFLKIPIVVALFLAVFFHVRILDLTVWLINAVSIFISVYLYYGIYDRWKSSSSR